MKIIARWGNPLGFRLLMWLFRLPSPSKAAITADGHVSFREAWHGVFEASEQGGEGHE